MSDEFDNNPKATDPGTQSVAPQFSGSMSGSELDGPASKRNKSADPTQGPGGVDNSVQ